MASAGCLYLVAAQRRAVGGRTAIEPRLMTADDLLRLGDLCRSNRWFPDD